MRARSNTPELLVDTSVAVALTVADHAHHDQTFAAVRDRRLGLAGHAAFETFSVLSRLPPPVRRSPSTIARLLATSFPYTRFLGAGAAGALLNELASSGVAGGAVYDALIGACANEHGLPLATRDRRALETYRALDVRVELLA
jgi:predicted nucleic acid-binding protein